MNSKQMSIMLFNEIAIISQMQFQWQCSELIFPGILIGKFKIKLRMAWFASCCSCCFP